MECACANAHNFMNFCPISTLIVAEYLALASATRSCRFSRRSKDRFSSFGMLKKYMVFDWNVLAQMLTTLWISVHFWRSLLQSHWLKHQRHDRVGFWNVRRIDSILSVCSKISGVWLLLLICLRKCSQLHEYLPKFNALCCRVLGFIFGDTIASVFKTFEGSILFFWYVKKYMMFDCCSEWMCLRKCSQLYEFVANLDALCCSVIF